MIPFEKNRRIPQATRAMMKYIEGLETNPLWLLLQPCIKCEKHANYLYRTHVYYCEPCYDELKQTRKNTTEDGK